MSPGQMEVVTTLPPHTPLSAVAQTARRVEDLGFDTVHIPETVHDSLAVALLAAEHTERLTIRTSMTLAFPRSPMIIAYAAWDLARFSGGRFQLGLATQVRGNIVGRFSTPWNDPAGKLADYLGALQAIFTAFAREEPLHYMGPHYQFTRLQPYFNPGPSDVPAPSLYTGGVNQRVCQTAGALADGFVTHATNSHPKYLRERLLNDLAAGARRAGRNDLGPRVVVVPRCITGGGKTDLNRAREEVRGELAFLYSTPAYRPTLELLGLAEVGQRLTELVRDEDWTSLPWALPDPVLDQLVPQAVFSELPDALNEWYGGLCDGLNITLPPTADSDDNIADIVARIKHTPVRHGGDDR